MMQIHKTKWPSVMDDSEKKVLTLAYKGLTFVPESARKRIRQLDIEELDLSHNKLSYPTSCSCKTDLYPLRAYVDRGKNFLCLCSEVLHRVCKALILSLLYDWEVLVLPSLRARV